MNRLHRATILLQAISRLSPRMAVYMMRRAARNRFAPCFPARYRARLAAIEATLPTLGAPPAELPTGLRAVVDFYSVEYRGMMDAVLEGRVRLHGREIDFNAPDRIDWTHAVLEEGDHQMWRVKLSHMGFLCPMMVEGGPAHHAVVATLATSAGACTDPAAPGAFNAYWFPYAASHRILALGAGLLAARAAGGLPSETDRAVADLLRYNAAFVLDNIEHELNNNHVERNLAALCLYFSHTEAPPPPWIVARLENCVTHLLDTTLLPDGCQVERSPMYQGLSVTSLGVIAEAPFLSEPLRTRAQQATTAARSAFAILCHPDGKVALFNDSWHGEVPPLVGSAAPEGRSMLAQGGYGRLSQGDDLCLLDAGPLGPSWNPGHGHADFLSIEITLDGNRVIVDPGTSCYNTGPDRARERSAAAHNGPRFNDHEPVAFQDCFKVGRLAEAHLLPSQSLPEDMIAGVFRSGPGLVARLVKHYEGQGFLVADLWRAPAPHGIVTWLVPGDWQILPEGMETMRLTSGDAQAVIAILSGQNDGPISHFSHWACQYGRRESAYEIRLRPAPSRHGQSLLCWIGHVGPPRGCAKDGAALLDQLAEMVR